MRFRYVAMSLADWLELGVSLGYCTEPECETHNGTAMTEAERDEFEEGGDPCIPVVRLWLEGEGRQENDAIGLAGEAAG